MSGRPCGSQLISSKPGGFFYPSGVAVDPRTGDVYAAEIGNYRVQKLSASGEFIAMLGWEVNASMDERPGASRSDRNICTAVSGDRCKAGVAGVEAEQLSGATSVAVDPRTGDLYVLEQEGSRVDKYTSSGRFVWALGGRTSKHGAGSICRALSPRGASTSCSPATSNLRQHFRAGTFKAAGQDGNLLAVGGPEDLLYVGDEHRVQELSKGGTLEREILLASLSAEREGSVDALAVDRSDDVYLVYQAPRLEAAALALSPRIVREFNREGEQVRQFPVYARHPDANVHIDGISLGPEGVLAVIGVETGLRSITRFGFLYEARAGRLVGEYTPPHDNDGIAFSPMGYLYVAATDDQEVVGYVPSLPLSLISDIAPCAIALPNSFASGFDCAVSH